MNCLICGRATQPGKKLCADCRSARKRAFAATVTQPLLAAAGAGSGARLLKPSQSVAATARRAAEKALFVRSPRAEPTKGMRRASRADLVLLATAIGTILVVSAFALHRLNMARLEAKQLGEQAGVADRTGPRPDESVARAPQQPTPLPDLTARAVADLQAAPAGGTAEQVVAPTPKRASTRQRTPPVEAAPPTVEPEPSTQTLAVGPAVAPAVVHQAPRSDPLQVMNENLAQCASGDLFDRIACDQRVRRQFCAGQWGNVPQCQSGVANEHGQ